MLIEQKHFLSVATSITNTYSTFYKKVQKEILTSRDDMQALGICRNTLLETESKEAMVIDFGISNTKHHYLKIVWILSEHSDSKIKIKF